MLPRDERKLENDIGLYQAGRGGRLILPALEQSGDPGCHRGYSRYHGVWRVKFLWAEIQYLQQCYSSLLRSNVLICFLPGENGVYPKLHMTLK